MSLQLNKDDFATPVRKAQQQTEWGQFELTNQAGIHKYRLMAYAPGDQIDNTYIGCWLWVDTSGGDITITFADAVAPDPSFDGAALVIEARGANSVILSGTASGTIPGGICQQLVLDYNSKRWIVAKVASGGNGGGGSYVPVDLILTGNGHPSKVLTYPVPGLGGPQTIWYIDESKVTDADFNIAAPNMLRSYYWPKNTPDDGTHSKWLPSQLMTEMQMTYMLSVNEKRHKYLLAGQGTPTEPNPDQPTQNRDRKPNDIANSPRPAPGQEGYPEYIYVDITGGLYYWANSSPTEGPGGSEVVNGAWKQIPLGGVDEAWVQAKLDTKADLDPDTKKVLPSQLPAPATPTVPTTGGAFSWNFVKEKIDVTGGSVLYPRGGWFLRVDFEQLAVPDVRVSLPDLNNAGVAQTDFQPIRIMRVGSNPPNRDDIYKSAALIVEGSNNTTIWGTWDDFDAARGDQEFSLDAPGEYVELTPAKWGKKWGSETEDDPDSGEIWHWFITGAGYEETDINVVDTDNAALPRNDAKELLARPGTTILVRKGEVVKMPFPTTQEPQPITVILYPSSQAEEGPTEYAAFAFPNDDPTNPASGWYKGVVGVWAGKFYFNEKNFTDAKNSPPIRMESRGQWIRFEPCGGGEETFWLITAGSNCYPPVLDAQIVQDNG